MGAIAQRPKVLNTTNLICTVLVRVKAKRMLLVTGLGQRLKPAARSVWLRVAVTTLIAPATARLRAAVPLSVAPTSVVVLVARFTV